jgi:nucleoside-diphosphate-sugar epimerase
VQIVVTGACTALGQALLKAVVARGVLTRYDGQTVPVRRIIAVDRVQPPRLFVDTRVEYVRGDYEQPRFLARMMGVITDSVFHLSVLGAASAAASDDDTPFEALDNALLRSLDTTRALLDACHYQTVMPRLVFASIEDVRTAIETVPRSTDAVCAALCELLLAESARRDLVDGRCVRLPCVVGGGASADARAIEALLAAAAAGDAAAANEAPAPGALTPVPVVTLQEAAAALLDAHERERPAAGGAFFVDLPGRMVRIAELAP